MDEMGFHLFIVNFTNFLKEKHFFASLLIFNQSAVWLLPSSYICILISIALGILMFDDKKIKMNVLE